MRGLVRACYFTGVGRARFEPKNTRQAKYDLMLGDKKKPIVFAVGPSGTGKTLFACEHAIRSFEEKTVDKIVITRPAVSVEEQHGFLPGSLDEKMDPWMRPIYDVFDERWGVDEVNNLRIRKKLEICPLAYMRGRTFKRSWVIADEMQNATPEQMKMLLTRIGEGTKMVITGDPDQHDRGYEANGLTDVLERLRTSEDRYRSRLSVIEFTDDDVERHPVVRDVLRLYYRN